MTSLRTNGPATVLAIFLVGACGGGGGGDGGGGGGITPPPPPPPAATAILRGLVREERDGEPLPGATVTLGTVTVTAGPTGTFELPNASIGAATVTVKAAGYDPLARPVTLVAGTNVINPVLVRVNTIYSTADALIYVPAEVTTIRGVFIRLYGGNTDNRPAVTGDLETWRNEVTPAPTEYRRRMMAFARENGLAVLGIVSGDHATILPQLTELARVSGHPELAQAPAVLHGHSNGARMACYYAGHEPSRVIGFIAAKIPDCDPTAPPRTVPAYFIMSTNDPVLNNRGEQITKLFETQRARGAPWALLLDPAPGHQEIANYDLLFNWMQEVVTRRLPATPAPGAPVALRTIGDPSGWLGERTSFSIADYPCYVGDKLAASWLPSQQTARDWQAMVSTGSTQTVIGC
jgi:hypothetical protein